MNDPELPYLMRLADRLNAGLATFDLNEKRWQRHRFFLLKQQQEDGGFGGRDGDSDLYYTSFAVRGLAMLNGLSEETCEKIASFLRPYDYEQLGAVDLLSWLYSSLVMQLVGGIDLLSDVPENWNQKVGEILEQTRRPDGGYAKSVEGAAGSTYQSFMTALTYELIGLPLPQPNSLIQFLYDRQRDDGGFVEIAPMKRSGTNPTAAAVALLNMLGGMDDEVRDDVRAFFKDVRSDEGGLQANTRIAFADGLSTFTGMLTMQDLGVHDVLKMDRVETFLTEWLEFPTGGFRGASWDDQADVEYTFYGLGCLALIASARANSN